jgi:hypothetical protein
MPTLYEHGPLNTLPTLSGSRRYLDPNKIADDQTGIEEWDGPRSKYGEQVQELAKRRGAHTAARSAIATADRDHKQATITAVRKNEPAPADPLPKLQEKEEKAKRAVEIQEAVVLELSDELATLHDDLKPQFLAEAEVQRAEAVSALELGVASLQQAWNSLADAQWLRQWANGSHKASRSVPGVEHLNKLAQVIEDLADTTEPRSVSASENKKLRAGEDAVDINGEPITYEEADALYRKGKLRVSHGKPLPRSSTGFGDAG